MGYKKQQKRKIVSFQGSDILIRSILQKEIRFEISMSQKIIYEQSVPFVSLV